MEITVTGSWRAFRAVGRTPYPDRVWELWTRPATWGRWDTGLREASLDGPWVPGARGRLVDRGGRTSVFVVGAGEPGVSCGYRVDLPGARLELRRTLTSADPAAAPGVDGRSHGVRHEVRFAGPLGPVWAAVLGRGFRDQVGPTVRRLLVLAGGEP